MGASPNPAQNDTAGEVFSIADATALNAFATTNGIGRMSAWSLNRDTTCGPNYVDLKKVSDSCSGVQQGNATFAGVLLSDFDGRLADSIHSTTTPEPTEQLADDPASSPYPIWSEDSSYLRGTKITRHHTVYEAKWWTKGDLPDDPVLNEWQTPWTLIGPVLPGEKPIPQPTLPQGTYADWQGTSAYTKGIRVLFDGVPYEAKWWNQGESPEAASSSPDSSPWVPLTLKQISEVTTGATATTAG